MNAKAALKDLLCSATALPQMLLQIKDLRILGEQHNSVFKRFASCGCAKFAFSTSTSHMQGRLLTRGVPVNQFKHFALSKTNH